MFLRLTLLGLLDIIPCFFSLNCIRGYLHLIPLGLLVRYLNRNLES